MVVPPKAAQEAKAVAGFEKESPRTSGHTFYLVDACWWNKWREYSGFRQDAFPGCRDQAPGSTEGHTPPRPGPIDNKPLLRDPESEERLTRAKLLEHDDFVVVTRNTWDFLMEEYGGGPAIMRPAIQVIGNPRAVWVPTEPLHLSVHCASTTPHGSPQTVKVVVPSKAFLVRDLKALACSAMGVEADDSIVLIDYHKKQRGPVLYDEANLMAALLMDGQDILLERKPHAAASKQEDLLVEGAGPIRRQSSTGEVGGTTGRGTRQQAAESEDDAIKETAAVRRQSSTGEAGGAGPTRTLPELWARPSSRGSCDEDVTPATGAAPPRRASSGQDVTRDAEAGGSGREGFVALRRSGPGSATIAPAGGKAAGSSGAVGPGMKTRNGYKTASYLEDSLQQRPGSQPGLVGLSNLGNTCFMNSSLQCLVHALPLVECFLTSAYQADLNTTNPLGMKGELAEALARLTNNLWQPDIGFVTPRGFKAKIGHFAPQFSGYQQHDSQEFLAFLLDGLHEDMNRIRCKPYVEEKDIPGRSDDELAAEAWANYRLRNDSVVVDHFQGMYKSTLDCPQCRNASTKFDPFMYLSLPLPESRIRTIPVCVLTMDGSVRPTMYSVDVANTGTVRDLYVATAKVAGLQPTGSMEAHMLAAKVNTSYGQWNQTISTCPDPRARIAEVLDMSPRDNDLCVIYYYPDAASGPQAGLEQVTVSQRRYKRNSFASGGTANMSFYAAPLVMFVPASDLPGADHVAEHKQSYTSKFLVSPAAPIVSRVHEVFKPFRLAPPTPPEPAPPPCSAVAESAPQPMDMTDTETNTPTTMEGVQAPATRPDIVQMASEPCTDRQASPDIEQTTTTPAATAVPSEIVQVAVAAALAVSITGGGGGGASWSRAVSASASKMSVAVGGPADGGPTAVAAAVVSSGPGSGQAAVPGGPTTGNGGDHADARGSPYSKDAEFMDYVDVAFARQLDGHAPTPPTPSRPNGAACGTGSTDISAPASPTVAHEAGPLPTGQAAEATRGVHGSATWMETESRLESAPPAERCTTAASGREAEATRGDQHASKNLREGTQYAALAGLGERLGTLQQQQEQEDAQEDRRVEERPAGAWGAAAWGEEAVGYQPLPPEPVEDDVMDPGTPEAHEGTGTGQHEGPWQYDHVASTGRDSVQQGDNGDTDEAPQVASGGAILLPPAPPPSSPRRSSGAGATGGTPSSPFVDQMRADEPLVPFDMWAGQTEVAGPSNIDDASDSVAFYMYMASEKNLPDFYSFSRPVLGGHRSFVLDWVDPQGPSCEATSGATAWWYDVDALASPEEHASVVAHTTRARAGARPVGLSACVEAFLQPEQLSEEDSWYCPKCKMHVQADKKLDLWHLPEVLVVHLKRFSYTRYHRDKLETPVDFPLEGLDLSPYVLRPQGTPPVYDCFAVSNHFGSLGGGHYTAYCRTEECRWHCFDDSHVSAVHDPASEVRSPAAYVLFYRRRAEAAQQPADFLPRLLAARRAQQESEAEHQPASDGLMDQEQDQDVDSVRDTRTRWRSKSDVYRDDNDDDLLVTGRSTAVVVAGQVMDTTPPQPGGAGGRGSGFATPPLEEPVTDMFAFDEEGPGELALIKADPDPDVDDELYGSIDMADVVPSSSSSPDDSGLDRMACSPT